MPLVPEVCCRSATATAGSLNFSGSAITAPRSVMYDTAHLISSRQKTEFADFPGQSRSGGIEEDGRDLYFSAGIDFLLTPETHFTLEYAEYIQSDVFGAFDARNDSDFTQDYIGIGIGVKF